MDTIDLIAVILAIIYIIFYVYSLLKDKKKSAQDDTQLQRKKEK